MASYKLYTPEASFRAFAGLIAAEYNEISVEICTDLSAASLSPTGKLPLLEIESSSGATTRIFSSQAIARYLAAVRRDTGLVGANFVEQASIDAWVDFSAQDLELPACIWFYPVAGYMPFTADAYEKAKIDLAAGLSVLETHLKDKTFLVGDQVTLADILVASTLLYPFKLVCDKDYLLPYGNVTRWFQTCVSQPEFQQVIGQVTMCKKETLAPGQTAAPSGGSKKEKPEEPEPPKPKEPEPVAPSATSDVAEESQEDRRVVSIAVTPVSGVDPNALYAKIKETIKSQPQYKLKWDDACKVENGKIYTTFTIAVEADFDEEVMEWIEMMEDEVAGQEVTFQAAME